MKKKLTPKEIIFNLDLSSCKEECESKDIKDVITPYNKIRRALKIKKEGYNLFLIDSFSKDKINEIIRFVEDEYKSLEPPLDICYVTLKDSTKPFPVFLENGRGEFFKKDILSLKEEYTMATIEFGNIASNEEKDAIVEEIHTKRGKYIKELMDLANEQGFDVKATSGGFAFIPLKGEEALTEGEYDELLEEEKDELLSKANKLKENSEDILKDLRDLEVDSLKRVKEIFREFLDQKMSEIKEELLLEYIVDDDVYNYLEKLFLDIENELVEGYSIEKEEEEEDGGASILKNYNIEVIVNNSEYSSPRVIYEDDPTATNLLGNIEYENQNGNYITDISLINAGSMLKANGGAIIIRLNDLITNPNSYYYLKKTLISGKVSLDTNKNYLEVLSINGLKPEPIPINIKVILIGDYGSYSILYNNDEDFKRLFPLKCEALREIESKNFGLKIVKYIENIREKNGLNKLSVEGIFSIVRYLARNAENRKKVAIDYEEIEKLLILSNEISKEDGDNEIKEKHINAILYEEDIVEDEYMSMFKDGKIFIEVEGEKIGSVNGLAVLDTGIHSFGKPMRISCLAVKGEGIIRDIHKDSKLSGKIHEKSIYTLKGILSSIVSIYEKLPINLHLSFEQSYGIIEGDSASVAEMIGILSAISKRGVRQNIAVTGSLNQFRDVQPIGGVNEKIEGFYRVCKDVDKVLGKGVLIPNSNVEELILKPEVEESIKKGEFSIYSMETLEDAIEVLLLNEGEKIEDFYKLINKEILKYKD